MKILMACMPFAGHVQPAMVLAEGLTRRGHSVRLYTGGQFQAAVEGAGVAFRPTKMAPHFAGYQPSTLDVVCSLFMRAGPPQLVDLAELVGEETPDVILSDPAVVGAWTFFMQGIGIPWATFGNLPLMLASHDTPPFGTGEVPPRPVSLDDRARYAIRQEEERKRVRAFVGLPEQPLTVEGVPVISIDTGEHPLDMIVSPMLYLQGTIPEFEYPRRDLPGHVHFIGPLVAGKPTTPDGSVSEFEQRLMAAHAAGETIVHVSQGTVATNPSDLVIPTLEAMAGSGGVRVIASARREASESWGIPANAMVSPWVPHGLMMEYADVFVTNGGYGGVSAALAHGVPMVAAAAASEDKPEVAARIAYAGVGCNLGRHGPTRGELRAAIGHVLGSTQIRMAAAELRTRCRQRDPILHAEVLLQRLVATNAPVMRPEP